MGSCDTVSPGAAFFGAHVFGTVQLKICKRYRVGSSPVKGVGSFSCVPYGECPKPRKSSRLTRLEDAFVGHCQERIQRQKERRSRRAAATLETTFQHTETVSTCQLEGQLDHISIIFYIFLVEDFILLCALLNGCCNFLAAKNCAAQSSCTCHLRSILLPSSRT